MRNKTTARDSLFTVGQVIRRTRKQQGLSLDELAWRTGLSKGLLSKIENFRAIPSLPVLVSIAQSLKVSIDKLVSEVENRPESKYQLVRATERTPLQREKARGYNYEALLARPLGQAEFEAFVLNLKPGAKRKPVTTEGEQFMFILSGRIEFYLGDNKINLGSGDAIFFDGRIPHTSINTEKTTAQLLAIYLLKHNPNEGNDK